MMNIAFYKASIPEIIKKQRATFGNTSTSFQSVEISLPGLLASSAQIRFSQPNKGKILN